MRVAILIITLLNYALVINAFTSAAGKRRHIQYHNSQIKSTSSCDDDTSESEDVMIIFRSPSHHTYGFIDPNNNNEYDLPMVELQNLMGDDEQQDIQFIPINKDLQSTSTKQPKLLSRNQSKKKKKDVYKHNIPLMYWVKNSTGDTIDHTIIAKATSHSILTHSAFAINKYYNISDEVWRDAVPSSTAIIDDIDIIDMQNPNMSNHDRTDLIQRIANFIEYNQLQCIDDVNKEEGRQPIIIHDIIHQHHNIDSIHHLYFGYRLSIGLAGTTGAPSRTLRRTKLGILKKYALKNRSVSNKVAYDTSTAMEPEIGFLMINLALAGTEDTTSSSSLRVLDPCCGSGRLLLYAAASGISKLVGVDYNQNVYRDAGLEFERYNFTPPIFIQGNVQSPLSTEVLCTPNSFDAIVCDPPYGIGAPILNGDNDKGRDEYSNKQSASRDIISSIIEIASNVLVKGGRLVFLLPVQGDSMSISLEKLLQSDLEKNKLRLLKSSSRLQTFSPTFARWLVCMEKC